MKKVILLTALLAISMNAQANEGLSRQIKSLKTTMESFAQSAKNRMDVMQGEIDGNESKIQSFEDCAAHGMVYADGAPNADADGCIRAAASSSVSELNVESQFVPSGRWLHPYQFTESAKNGSPAKRGRSYARIYRIDDPDMHENYTIRTNAFGHGGGDADHRSSCWGAYPIVKVGGKWYKVSSGTINIQNIANKNSTFVNGVKRPGKFERQVAVIHGTVSGCGQNAYVFTAYKLNYISYSQGFGESLGPYGRGTPMRTISILAH